MAAEPSSMGSTADDTDSQDRSQLGSVDGEDPNNDSNGVPS